jgi:hypothetical protein
MRPTDGDFGKIIVFEHEVLEACVDAYKQRINSQLRLDVLKDIQKWYEKFQMDALTGDDPFEQQTLRDTAAELVSLICIYIAEFVE